MIEPKDGEWWMVELNSGDKRVMRYWLREGDSGAVWNVFKGESNSFFSASSGVKPLYKMVKAEEPKPRTKVVYEKVTFKRVTEIFEILESGEWLYTSNNGDSHIDLYLAMSLEPCTMIDREFYRKVEKEIDWKDELSFFFGRLDYGVVERSEYHQGEIGLSMEINEIDFISMCHLVASLTDKPE